MAHNDKPIPEDIQREAEEELRRRMPDGGEAEADERFLETEAPYNDERRRYSPEYGSAPNAPDELSANPDGKATYPEEESFVRARGENTEGTKESIDKARRPPANPLA